MSMLTVSLVFFIMHPPLQTLQGDPVIVNSKKGLYQGESVERHKLRCNRTYARNASNRWRDCTIESNLMTPPGD